MHIESLERDASGDNRLISKPVSALETEVSALRTSD